MLVSMHATCIASLLLRHHVPTCISAYMQPTQCIASYNQILVERADAAMCSRLFKETCPDYRLACCLRVMLRNVCHAVIAATSSNTLEESSAIFQAATCTQDASLQGQACSFVSAISGKSLTDCLGP